MNKFYPRRVFEPLQEKLNWCPHCGEKPGVYQCKDCDTIHIACSCSFLTAGKVDKVLSDIDAVALIWNNYGLKTKWDRKVLEHLTLSDKEWLVVYETGKIVACGSLEDCYHTACSFQDDEEYKNSSFAIFTLENDTPRFMGVDEIFRKLNVKD